MTVAGRKGGSYAGSPQILSIARVDRIIPVIRLHPDLESFVQLTLWITDIALTTRADDLGIPPPAQPGTVSLLSLAGVAGILEVFGGLLLLVGLFTRPVAFLLSGEMAVAYFMVHAPQGFWPVLNRGELAALYSFVFLYLAAAGGGPWSIDHLRQRS